MLPDRQERAKAVPLLERAALAYKMDERTGHAWVPRRNHTNQLAEVECLRCGLVLPVTTLSEWDRDVVAGLRRLDDLVEGVAEPCPTPGARLRAAHLIRRPDASR